MLPRGCSRPAAKSLQATGAGPFPPKAGFFLTATVVSWKMTFIWQKGLSWCNFEMRAYPRWTWWAWCNHKGPYEKEDGDKEDWSAIATGQEMLAISRSAKKQGTASPLESSGETSPVNTLILALEGSLQTPDFQNWKIINLCCFEALSFWSFVTAIRDEYSSFGLGILRWPSQEFLSCAAIWGSFLLPSFTVSDRHFCLMVLHQLPFALYPPELFSPINLLWF